MTTGQQLYAKIKKSSKYADQNNTAKRQPECYGGFPFPVHIDVHEFDGYLVRGGPGGRYRLSDVNLFIVEDGREVRIS